MATPHLCIKCMKYHSFPSILRSLLVLPESVIRFIIATPHLRHITGPLKHVTLQRVPKYPWNVIRQGNLRTEDKTSKYACHATGIFLIY